MGSISHIIIGIFESEFDALAAVDELLSHGFARHDIHLSDRSNTNRSLLAHEDDDHEKRVVRFFKTVFSDNDEEAQKYARVALESGSVITVYAHSNGEANTVADMLDERGALDVDECAAQLNSLQPKKSGLDTFEKFDALNNADNTIPPVTGMIYEDSTEVVQTDRSGHKSRIIACEGKASQRLREDVLNETKFW